MIAGHFSGRLGDRGNAADRRSPGPLNVASSWNGHLIPGPSPHDRRTAVFLRACRTQGSRHENKTLRYVPGHPPAMHCLTPSFSRRLCFSGRGMRKETGGAVTWRACVARDWNSVANAARPPHREPVALRQTELQTRRDGGARARKPRRYAPRRSSVMIARRLWSCPRQSPGNCRSRLHAPARCRLVHDRGGVVFHRMALCTLASTWSYCFTEYPRISMLFFGLTCITSEK